MKFFASIVALVSLAAVATAAAVNKRADSGVEICNTAGFNVPCNHFVEPFNSCSVYPSPPFFEICNIYILT